MTFTLALTLLTSIAATALALLCYSLAARVDTLEKAVVGGLAVPSRRLTREQFESRLRQAHNRVEFAKTIDHGLIIFAGTELADSGHELHQILKETSANFAMVATKSGSKDSDVSQLLTDAGFKVSDIAPQIADPILLGVESTPYGFLIDQGRILKAQPVVTAEDLITLGSAH